MQCWKEAGTDTEQEGEGVLSYLRCTHKRDGECTVIDINVQIRRRDTAQEGRGDVPRGQQKHRLLVRETTITPYGIRHQATECVNERRLQVEYPWPGHSLLPKCQAFQQHVAKTVCRAQIYHGTRQRWRRSCAELMYWLLHEPDTKARNSSPLSTVWLLVSRFLQNSQKFSVFLWTSVKVKVVLEQATKAQRGSRGIALLFHKPRR
jgi:hypothetical protein